MATRNRASDLSLTPGSTASFRLIRSGQELELPITIGTRPASNTAQQEHEPEGPIAPDQEPARD
ncbi:MAG: hypothetical protein Q4D19_01870 [Lautropia sp.]|nr:hypothetical protein [Lautropia sp.]